ncbi:MAG: class II aldolase/adducin family protein [Desulfovibrionaceae bacterium]|nr:class II aldolase/adducin family protein [Desulfovibrionaceae bacterium]MBF0512503.1 class II aldolase/adducin family protein [Desulfovibrionaceae bacterium]
MERLIAKYEKKLVDAGLADPGAPLLAGLDAELIFNRKDPATAELAQIFDGLHINSLLYCRPAEPYRTIVDYLSSLGRTITPEDCETRTFQHDIPVASRFHAPEILACLRRRKSVIIPGAGVIAHGVVSPEQAFVTYSSVLFACFVKFFGDYLAALEAGHSDPSGRPSAAFQAAFNRAVSHLDPVRPVAPVLAKGPFATAAQVYEALDQAGKATVDYRLVDSFFGNISYSLDDVLYISQTGSSLDELPGHVDPCPLDGSSCAGLTASSEFSAHAQVALTTTARAILHGHPKFSVLMSMRCAKKDCDLRGACHLKCPSARLLGDVPIVPGEVGSGPTGLCHTMPQAMRGNRAVMVHGHGLFAAGETDFNEPFATLLTVENASREAYFKTVAALS